MIGERFGRLIVIEKASTRPCKHDTYWLCRCDCGGTKLVTTAHLKSSTKSCGCLRKEQSVERFRDAAKNNISHGEAKSRLYGIWHAMRQRCENPNTKAYKWYGGKGVIVCDEWKDYARFAKWAYLNGYSDDIGSKIADKLSIDRVNSDGNYCPENCRWITVSENTRRASKKRWENARKHTE